MKFKTLAVLGLAVAIALGSTGCNSVTPHPPSETADLKETHGALSERIDDMIHEDAELTALAEVLAKDLPSAATADADSAVLLYVKYADSKSAQLASEWVYNTPELSDKFYKVFGEEFGYQWDESKIDSITDQEIKALFTKLKNAYMRIEAYGAYLGPVVDYKKIAELPNLSEQVKNFYYGVSGLYTTGRLANQLKGLDYSATAKYAADMEDAYRTAKDLTLKESAASMLSFALNLYYTGTEGSSPFDFEKNTLSQTFIDATKTVIDTYGDYHVAKLGKQFLEISDANNGQLSSDFADLVINYKKFGFDSEKSVKSSKVVKEPNYFEITPVFSGFDDPSVEEKIAAEIAAAVGQIKETVEWEKTENTNYHLSYIVDFANDHYFSLQLSGVSYNQENSTNLYDNISMIIDAKTGERITLKELFGNDYDKNIKAIRELVLKDIVEKQRLTFKTTKDIEISDNVLLDANYMMVSLKKGSYSDEQQYDIVSYVPYSDLLSTFDMDDYLRGSK